MASGASLRRERLGWAFGLNAPQLGVVAVAVAPALALMAAQRYVAAPGWVPVAVLMVSLVVVPIRGRVAVTWLTHWVGHTTGRDRVVELAVAGPRRASGGAGAP